MSRIRVMAKKQLRQVTQSIINKSLKTSLMKLKI